MGALRRNPLLQPAGPPTNTYINIYGKFYLVHSHQTCEEATGHLTVFVHERGGGVGAERARPARETRLAAQRLVRQPPEELFRQAVVDTVTPGGGVRVHPPPG